MLARWSWQLYQSVVHFMWIITWAHINVQCPTPAVKHNSLPVRMMQHIDMGWWIIFNSHLRWTLSMALSNPDPIAQAWEHDAWICSMPAVYCWGLQLTVYHYSQFQNSSVCSMRNFHFVFLSLSLALPYTHRNRATPTHNIQNEYTRVAFVRMTNWIELKIPLLCNKFICFCSSLCHDIVRLKHCFLTKQYNGLILHFPHIRVQ